MRKKITLAATALVLLLGVPACADKEETAPSGGDTATTTPATTASGTFAAYQAGQTAVVYDRRLVPAGADAGVRITRGAESSEAVLRVRGLLPNHAYGAHVHVNPCGPKPDDAGPHYQHISDPVQPSVDPRYANAQNEVWLDFTTDAEGNAETRSRVAWAFRGGGANSVVIHAGRTSTEPGKAGTAGARAACLTIPL